MKVIEEKDGVGGPFHVKYRPTSFKQVMGNRGEVDAFARVIEQGEAHAFLLTGPAGVGKTSLARIGASVLDCDVIEIDAASKTGVDDMREVQDAVRYPSLDGRRRAVVLDELHRASGQAFDSLLKIIEEPPPHLFWFLCTTNPAKVPKTIQTRCVEVALKPLAKADMMQVLERVVRAEKLKLCDDRVLDDIVFQSDGSPRQALVYLAKVEGCRTMADVATAIKKVQEGSSVIEFCRFMVYGKKRTWAEAMRHLEGMEEESPEGIRIVLSAYVAKVLKSPKMGDEEACRLLGILDAFSGSYVQSEQWAPLYRSIGHVLFAGD